ncbi:hypothetical protein CERSUDRAFT_79718 [Gelatoporia subvermispora B]|uniref:ditrans,polycis-polyprenyl diphosphate synthase [(2E,6E)-farnesyldiphosphate specific] n=1 Tax=Ceriporiopsis subvermispora (strain B) TaxID=914234 RepID=M2RT50_CERS8|nr:hypothetical protein CERSUDRAFT_79718 [Gelatoporia subvermispora B]
MFGLASLALYILHALYWIYNTVKSTFGQVDHLPAPLDAKRPKLPQHLAFVLYADSKPFDTDSFKDQALEAVQNLVSWCRVVGITRLSVYDRHDILPRVIADIRELFDASSDDISDGSVTDSGLEFPPTPPESDSSDSRPVSPNQKSQRLQLGVTTLELAGPQDRTRQRLSAGKHTLRRRRQSEKDIGSKTLTLHILSQRSSKAAISTVASSLLRTSLAHHRDSDHKTQDEEFSVSIEDLKASLEGEHGFPPPDLMIVRSLTPRKHYKVPLELHGFPPWQIRLTEIYHDERPQPHWPMTENRTSALEEVEFRRALDSFASAEMRLGR